jgi:hypothetical protein
VTQPSGPTPPQRYQSAVASYLTDWQHIDVGLINLVRTHSSGSLQDVHLRVVFMNGVYRAQLNRTIGPNAEFRAARALHSQWRTVTNAIAPLTAFSNPSANAMTAVVAAHQAIVTILQNAFPKSPQATSFASKFLWPDAPNLVPIFDSRTDRHARQHRLDYAASVGPLRAAMTSGQGNYGNYVYFEHALRYMATYQTLAAAGLPSNVLLTMKGIDHMYWLG